MSGLSAILFFSSVWPLAQAPVQEKETWIRPDTIDSSVEVVLRLADNNPKMRYFLMEKKDQESKPAKKGLVLVLPGGNGGEGMLPFCANFLVADSIPPDYRVAQLVAPIWSDDPKRVLWPGVLRPEAKALFTTETFLEKTIADVKSQVPLDESRVFLFGWTNSGHILYSAPSRIDALQGSFVAMSRFPGETSFDLDKVKGKIFLIYHSPEDRIFPFAEIQKVETLLKAKGAKVRLVPYKGGHGWSPTDNFTQTITQGMRWMDEQASTPKLAPPK